MISDAEIKQEIGRKLRELRKKAGYGSHEDFALEHHIPRVSYFKCERGSTNITLNTLLELLSIHQISLGEFFQDFKSIPDIPRSIKQKRNKA